MEQAVEREAAEGAGGGAAAGEPAWSCRWSGASGAGAGGAVALPGALLGRALRRVSGVSTGGSSRLDRLQFAIRPMERVKFSVCRRRTTRAFLS